MLKYSGIVIYYWIVIICNSLYQTGCDQSTWYIGCYNIIDIFKNLNASTLTLTQFDHGLIIPCLRTCLEMGYPYLALNPFEGCVCISQLPDDPSNTLLLSQSSCDTSCQVSVSDFLIDRGVDASQVARLPCGGSNSTSIYRSAGPVLSNITISTVKKEMYTDQEFAISIHVKFSGNPTMQIGVDDIDINAAKMYISACDQIHIDHATDTSAHVQASVLCTISTPGIYISNVVVANSLSEVVSHLNVSIILPIPTELKVTLMPNPKCMPSCVPTNYSEIAVQSVFRNVSLRFEAMVPVSTHLTFAWTFDCLDDNLTSYNLTENGTDCYEGQSCTFSIQQYAFPSLGNCFVAVQAKNDIVDLQSIQRLIVMPFGIHDLTLETIASDDVLKVLPGIRVDLKVSMVATMIQSTVLAVDFGDGDVKHYAALREFVQDKNTNNRSDGLPRHDPDRDSPVDDDSCITSHNFGDLARDVSSAFLDSVQMIGSYSNSDGCFFQLLISHVYPLEGHYVSTVFVSDGHETVNATLKHLVMVENNLDAVTLYHKSVEAVNKLVSFNASLVPDSVFAIFHWTVVCDDPNLDTPVITTLEPTLSHTFTARGKCTVILMAENGISSRSVQTDIVIEIPISLINIKCNLTDRFLKTGTNVSCVATVDGGSNVNFVWSFNDDVHTDVLVTSINLTSVASHQYLNIGRYNISITAYNAYNSVTASLNDVVTVVEPVTNLLVTLPGPLTVGDNVSIAAMVSTGTNLLYQFDFGDRYTISVVGNEPLIAVRVAHAYSQPGNYLCTVRVFNEISTEKQVFTVDIFYNIHDLAIESVGPAVAGRRTLFAASMKAILSPDFNIVYNWSVDGVSYAITQSPITNYLFKTPGLYKVSVTAFNSVSSQTNTSTINVLNESDVIAFDQIYFSDGNPMVFNLINLPTDHVELEVSYGENWSSEVIRTIGPTFSWEHVYDHAGLYRVHIRCCNLTSVDPRNVVVDTYVSVQQRVANLILNGSTLLTFNKVSKLHQWEAIVSSGSNLIFWWTFDSDPAKVTANSIMSNEFQPGGHSIVVMAGNDLGNDSTNLTVFVQHSITYITINNSYAVIGHTSEIILTIHGDREFNISVDFGDGSTQMYTTDNSSDFGSSGWQLIPLAMVSVIQNNTTPAYQANFSHLYEEADVFVIEISVSNFVSHLTDIATVTVFHALKNFELYTNSPTNVATGSMVNVMAAVFLDYDLYFHWSCEKCLPGSMTSKVSNGSHWLLSANVTLPYEDKYTITLNISNPVANTYQTANMTFTTFDPVDDLTVYTATGINSAALYKTPDENWETDDIYFGARVNQGFDVIFVFDFGDGSVSTVNGVPGNFDPGSKVENVEKVYNKFGAYNISVTAMNLVSSRTDFLTFVVQVPPSGLAFENDPPVFKTRINQDILFRVSIKDGTDVLYNWNMGDMQYYNNAGPSISHRYLSYGAPFILKVTAYNQVQNETISREVYVQDIIQSVELTCWNTIHKTGDDVVFEAITHPEIPFIVDFFYWKIDNGSYQKNIPQPKVHKFTRPGTYSVYVIAENSINRISSEPLIVQILAPITAVTIKLIEDAVTNKPVALLAYFFQGSSPTYEWKFGDNSTTVMTENTVKHDYPSIGRYTVEVNVTNAVSWQDAKMNIFVLDFVCKPPEIDFVKTGVDTVNFSMSDNIAVEAKVLINCTATNVTVYTWIICNATDGSNLMSVVFNDPVLYLTPYSLSYGQYSVLLHVSMNGTIVYSVSEVPFKFNIVPSPLQAVIYGGLQRNVWRNGTAILDASSSIDPDFPNSRNMNFSWSCEGYQQVTVSKSCFLDDVNISLSQPLLYIPGSWFRSDLTSFLFTLTIWKAGRMPAMAVQLIYLQSNPAINVRILCKECRNHSVIANEPLTLEAVNTEFLDSELDYEWTLFEVDDNRQVPIQGQRSCMQADGLLWSFSPNNKSQANVTTSSNNNVAIAYETFTASYDALSDVASDATTMFASSGLNRPPFPAMLKPVPPAWPNFADGPGGSRGRRPPGDDGYQGGVPIPLPGGASSGLNRPPFPAMLKPVPPAWPNFADGPGGTRGRRPPGDDGYQGGVPIPSPRGDVSSTVSHISMITKPQSALDDVLAPVETPSSNGRNHGQGQASSGLNRPPFPATLNPVPPTWPNFAAGPGGSRGGRRPPGDDGYQGGVPIPLPGGATVDKLEKIFSLNRIDKILLPGETKTGMNGRFLSINPNVLTQGLRYIAQVIVTHKASKSTGNVLMSFTVQISPDRGKCSFKPENRSGIEIETQFSIYCPEWKDPHNPIRYEVSYNTSSTMVPRLIYRGLKNNVDFLLPAGNPHNFTVSLNIRILNKHGAATLVCMTNVTVLPTLLTENNLLNMVNSTSLLQRLFDKGENRLTRLRSLFIVNQLNRYKSGQSNVSVTNREYIRTKLLTLLNGMPLRDVCEVQQSLVLLTALTDVESELTVDALVVASAIVNNISIQITRLVASTPIDGYGVLPLSLNATFNLLSAASELEGEGSLVQQSRWRDAMSTLMAVLENLLRIQSELNFFGGFAVYNLSTDAMTAYSAQFYTPDDLIIESQDLSLAIPTGIFQKSNSKSIGSSSCFHANAVLYKTNPFYFGTNDANEVQTNVLSITLYTCENLNAIKVNNLSKENQVGIAMPFNVTKENATLYRLHQEFMNVHSFNFTPFSDNELVHIDVQFNPLPVGMETFPISIIFTAESPPSQSHNSKENMWSYPSKMASIYLNISLKHFLLKGFTSYYVGLVSKDFNTATKRSNFVTERQYSLRIWSSRCVFWDDSHNHWSTAGCQMLSSASYSQANCRCNHLTFFAGQLRSFPYTLDQIGISTFPSVLGNYIIGIFIACVFIVFFLILAFVIKVDRHDDCKLTFFPLLDNAPANENESKHRYRTTDT